jgi:site-specific DNA-methyltransferase (adenine-specific)
VADSYRHGNPGKVNHPTQKPFGVIEPLIKGSSPINGIILDPFMGSGTTLVCAKRLSRKAVGIEIEEKYCEIAAKRLERTPTPLFPPDLPRKARKSQRRLL